MNRSSTFSQTELWCSVWFGCASLPRIRDVRSTRYCVKSTQSLSIHLARACPVTPIAWVTRIVSLITPSSASLDSLIDSAWLQTFFWSFSLGQPKSIVSNKAYYIDEQQGAWSSMLPNMSNDDWSSSFSFSFISPWMNRHGCEVDLHFHGGDDDDEPKL